MAALLLLRQLCSPRITLHHRTLPSLTKQYHLNKVCSSSASTLCRMHSGLHTSPTRNLHKSALSSQKQNKWQNIFTRRRHGNALPFEVETKIALDTLVFSYKNDRFYQFLTIFGVVQFFVWLNMASLMGFGGTDLEKLKESVNKDSFWGRFAVFQAENKSKAAVMCLLIGNGVLFFTYLYPLRSISKLTLLKGGTKVDISTYWHFGRQRHFSVPLESLSCQHGRVAAKSQLSLKIKGHWWFYLLDQQNGTFHNTKLFDYAIGLKRNL